MKAYFKLQFTLFNRKIDEIGLSLLLGYGLVFLIFYGTSFCLFSLTEFAEYLYCLIAFALISRLNNSGRNDFLKTIFSVNDYSRLRIIENLLIAFPFVIFLLFEKEFLLVLILISLSIFLSVCKFNNSLNYTIPTPFGKKPFEFLVGFRKTLLLFPLTYFITYQSILVGNFKLGVFSMLLITTVAISYYSIPENEIYVWNFSVSSKRFLLNKIGTGILCLTLLISPIIISLIVFFPVEIKISLGFLFLSFLYFLAIILAKYSVFPNEMNLPEVILLYASVFFPPLLLVIIPIFYTKSITQLNFILRND